ncbi:MAG: patatin-like phospholipase family protein [Pseudomonadota bacterium]
MQNRIGIALSGGGSRAMAFHLGCLRTLHKEGLLENSHVISCVSGGSVIGAMYASHKGTFDEFEDQVRLTLARGFVWPAIVTAFTSWEGPKALSSFIVQYSIAAISAVTSAALSIASLLLGLSKDARGRILPSGSWVRRYASRTTILRSTIKRLLFPKLKLDHLIGRRPKLVVIATELRTGSAFYFSSEESGSWRLGKCASNEIDVADAVAASAAYPLLLPALDEAMAFTKIDGTREVVRVNLTDGGVYDNLALSPLWPDRDRSVSIAVDDVDTIICCRAGYGPRFDSPSGLLPSRMKQVFYTVHDRAQNFAMNRLYDLKDAGKIKRFAIAHLGQIDERLEHAPDDLVSREETYGYPTDFSPMTDEWIERLTKRGEQVMLAVLRQHNPDLLTRG